MEKAEYYQLIGRRLSSVLKDMSITQNQLLLMCAGQNYQISQGSLSKLLSGSSVQLLHVAELCQVLNLNMSEILSLDADTPIHVPCSHSASKDQIITDARNKAFRAYLGSYHIYFYTTQNTDYIHRGIFKLSDDPTSHQCTVDFRFKTGERNENAEEIEKHYTGLAYYSISMQTIYCEFTSDEIGEKSYLLFHYNFLAYQNMECRLASAITVSAGIKRLPTMHRFLFTRQALSDDDLDYLCGELKLNSSEILISEVAYHEFLRSQKLPKSFFEYFGKLETQAERFLSSVAKVPYYSFNESLISDSFLPALDKIKIICLLRKYSSAPRYNKISAKAEEIVYNYLELQKKSASEVI